jgi:protein TonB
MLEYAASRPTIGSRQSSPNAMLLVISAHVALVAVVMSAKMEMTSTHPFGRTTIDLIPIPKPPPPTDPIKVKDPLPQPNSGGIDHPATKMPAEPRGDLEVNTGGATVDPGPIGGGGTVEFPRFPIAAPVHHDARLLTPASELKPPYPASKILGEEQAVLTLRLTIDDRGRVIAVEPIGPADRAFLDAARRHLMAHWRYQPATEDGRAMASSTIVKLRFELDA